MHHPSDPNSDTLFAAEYYTARWYSDAERTLCTCTTDPTAMHPHEHAQSQHTYMCDFLTHIYIYTYTQLHMYIYIYTHKQPVHHITASNHKYTAEHAFGTPIQPYATYTNRSQLHGDDVTLHLLIHITCQACTCRRAQSNNIGKH